MKSEKKKRLLAVVLCMVIVLSNSSFISASAETEQPAAVSEESVQQDVQEAGESAAGAADTPALLSETAPEETPEAASETTQTPEVTTEPTQASEETAEATQVPEMTETPEATSGETVDQTQEAAAESVQEPASTPDSESTEASETEETQAPTETTLKSNEAVELKQEFQDEDGNVTATVTAQIPAGAFQADTSEITMEVKVPDQENTEKITKLMEESLPENYILGDIILYDIRFKISGTETESQQPIVITFENQDGIEIKDVKKAVVFQLDPADPAVEGDKDELVTITQRNDMIEYLQNSGQSTDNVDDYDLSEITLKEDGTSDKIQMEGRTSTIYGCYVETLSEEKTMTQKVGDITVSVKAPEGAFSVNSDLVTMTADPLTEEQKELVEEQLQKQADEEGMEVREYVAYDINLWADGEKIQPQIPVTVTFENTGLEVKETETETVSGFQLDEEKKEVQEVNGDLDEEGDAVVEAEHFTVTGMVLNEMISSSNNSSVNFQFGDSKEGTQGSILTDEDLKYNNAENSNKWQIVDEQYKGNEFENKVLSDEGNVAVQKNVIATDVENEFLVYLSIDIKQMFREYFQIAEYEATTSNNYHGEAIGSVVSSMTGNESVLVTGDESAGYSNSSLFTILAPDKSVLAENVRLYWSQAENVTFYLKVDESHYILMGVKVKSGQYNKVQLTKEAMELIQEQVGQAAQIRYIDDVMGDYIKYVATVKCDGITDYNEETNTLKWTPELKTDPETSEERTEGDDETQITKWSHNVAELVYRVRLDVEKDGFNSCAENMDSAVGKKGTYNVNTKATLYYGDNDTLEFPVPHVRGLLYDIEFFKKDEESKPLSGAEFSVSGSYFGETITRTAVSASDGSVKIKGIPWGTYTLTETKVPEGYKSEYQGESITLCYTTDKDDLTSNHITPHESDEGNDNSRLLYGKKINNENIIINQKDTTSVFVKKEWNLPDGDYGHPDSVTVKLTATVNGNTISLPGDIITEVKLQDSNHWEYTFKNLPLKYENQEIKYSVIETEVGTLPTDESSYDSKVTGDAENGFTITNTLIDFWYICKVSSTDEIMGLEGALFTLTEETTGKKYFGKSYSSGPHGGQIAWFENETDVDNLDKVLRYVPDGVYTLEETQAPVGYQKSNVTWTITIENLQLNSIIDNNTGKEVQRYNPGTRALIREYHFLNDPLYNLPSAGGSGIFWYLIGGTAFLMAASLILYRMKRKEVLGK